MIRVPLDSKAERVDGKVEDEREDLHEGLEPSSSAHFLLLIFLGVL